MKTITIEVPVASSLKGKDYELARQKLIGAKVVDYRMQGYPDGIPRWTLVLEAAVPKKAGKR